MSTLLNFLVKTRNSDDDPSIMEDREILTGLCDSENFASWDEADEAMEDALGWSPITHWDREYAEKRYDEVMATAPQEISDELSLMLSREQFIQRVIEGVQNVKSATIDEAISELLSATVDWVPDMLQSTPSTSDALFADFMSDEEEFNDDGYIGGNESNEDDANED